ncbi:MAG: hypothetical protein AB9903_30725 [Vulcanimicrobiota bacterium]
MAESSDRFAPFRARMRAEKMPGIAIKTFEYYYNLLTEGQDGFIHE